MTKRPGQRAFMPDFKADAVKPVLAPRAHGWAADQGLNLSETALRA
jgi:hypothetical protein